MKKAKEGELYRSVTVYGKTFALHYGYYDEKERHSKYNEPIPIYPDLERNALYTDTGYRFVTAMQDACIYYKGKSADGNCHSCESYREGEELIGICVCPERKNKA